MSTEIEEKINSYKGWRHKIEVAPGIFTPGRFSAAPKLRALRIPERLDGKRVLDIGASDGFFSFECEKRGAAEVVAMDVRRPRGFDIAKEVLGSKVRYVQGSLYEEDLGEFDLVLCLNVLYHVKEVFTAIERLRTYCRGDIIINTMALDHGFQQADGTSHTLEEISPLLKDAALMQFLPTIAGREDLPSYWSVSSGAMRAMMIQAGFTIDDIVLGGTKRIFVWAHV